jgi:chemotaxis protein histidine kinase CheA
MKPIEEFKWHTKIIKTFGKKALIIYTAFPRTGALVDEEQISKLIEDEQSRKEIMDFMVSNGLIELAEEEGAPVQKPTARAPPREEAPAEEERPKARAPPKKEEIAPEAEEKPEEEAPPKREEEEKIEIVPEYEEKPEEIAPEEEVEREEIAPAPEKEEEAEVEKEEIAPEGEEKPRTRFLPQKKPKPEEEEVPEAETEAKEEIEPEEGMEAVPKTPEEETPEEEAAAGKGKEAPEEEEKPEAEAPPTEEEVTITSEHEEAEEEEEKGPSLTPAEMIVHDKYGEEGVLIFRLIDGKRSVADVAKESGATQDKVMEVLKYLDEVGLISLGGAGAEKEAKGGAAETQEEKFAPLSEETEASPVTIDEQKEGIRFAKVKPGAQFISKMKIKMSVVFKFGKSGREVLEFLDSRKEADAVHIVIKLNVPISTVEAILAYLKSEGFLDVSFMQREDIRKEFGYDAYIMYKRYGKKGVIFYEIIDKEIPLKQIADLISEKEPSKIIEIFKLIRDVLGIDLPINEDAIRKELFA